MLNISFIPFPVLHTARLTLRPLTLDDAENIFLLRSDSEVNKYLAREPAQTVDDAGAFIRKIIESSSKNDSVYWAINFTGNCSLIGTICLYGFSDEDDTCEVGYELLPQFHGRGVMMEALQKVIEYAFVSIKVKKIKAFFHRDNQKSKTLLERISFKEETQMDDKERGIKCYYLERSFLVEQTLH